MAAGVSQVRLFPTCLGEEFFPETEAATRAVLRKLGIEVVRPRGVLCCGQVAFNEGMRDRARDLARRFLASYKPGLPIVVPSGSCVSMLRVFYPDLLAEDRKLLDMARVLRPWIWEFSEFLVNSLKVTDVGARYPRAVTYHPSCHLMRELNIRNEPLTLLRQVRDIRLCDLKDGSECCGFGGLFSVKFPDISGAMLADKIGCIAESGAEVVVANDAGCLMQIGGGLHRRKSPIETRHLAQVLASE